MIWGNVGELLQQEQVEFFNNSGEEIPAFACLRISGASVVNQRNFLIASKPNIYGSQYLHFFNGPTKVAYQKYGVVYIGAVMSALYDTADGTPAFGESWGPRSGTWKIKKNTGGFMIVGNSDSSNGVVLVRQAPFLRFKGVTDAAINKDASGTVSIYYGSGTGTDSTVNMDSVYNAHGNVGSGKDVECVWDGDVGGTLWRIVAAECS